MSTHLRPGVHTDSGQLAVAIVGAGASGLMTARELLVQRPGVRIDLFDRNSEPWGLIGHGIAPDHADRDKWLTALAPVLADPRVSFRGEARLGQEVTREQLLASHDVVVYATGAPRQRPIGILGEQLPGSYPASDFFGWYTGAPNAPRISLAGVDEAVIVGLGDVAVDAARVLLKEPSEFAGTAMPAVVQAELAAHRVRRVCILVRRGPRNSDVKTRDLIELLNLPGVQVEVDQTQLGLHSSNLSDKVRSNLEAFAAVPTRNVPLVRATLAFKFWQRPDQILGRQRVCGFEAEQTRLAANGCPVGTGAKAQHTAQLVVAATGFTVDPLPGLPYGGHAKVIPTRDDRLVDESGLVQLREYVVGWAKRGAQGGFGTSRRDAEATVAHLLADLG